MEGKDISNNATSLYKQEQNLTNENMDTLEAKNLGPSVLTLQEAMSFLEKNQEGTLFQLKLKSSEEGEV